MKRKISTKWINLIRKTLKQIPLVRHFAKYLRKEEEFTSFRAYWINRYSKGMTSGWGSYKKLAEFKAEIINAFVLDNDIKTVIEFGCGDGNQLKYFNVKSYFGFEISQKAIETYQELFQGDQSKQFALYEQYVNATADLTLSLDVAIT